MSKKSKSLEQFLKGKNLNQITSLNLSSEDLTCIPSLVFKCRNLTKLNISNNQLTQIPKEIELLKKLKVLNLSNNKLTHITAPICRLPKLHTLDISHNLIKRLPKQLADSSIINLVANNNKLEVLDFNLVRNIQKLIISNNNILEFRPTITLANLKYLWINNNPCVEGRMSGIDTYFPMLKKIYPQFSLDASIHATTTDHHSMIKQPTMAKNKIFISYAHVDEKWLNLVKVHLKSLKQYVGDIEFWDDQKLRSGDKWKEEIGTALESATAAILIVSPNFLASDFITDNEVPTILEKAHKQGTSIFPLIARRCLFVRSPLAVYQAVNPPEKPLMACSEAEVDEYLYKLMEDIIFKLDLNTKA